MNRTIRGRVNDAAAKKYRCGDGLACACCSGATLVLQSLPRMAKNNRKASAPLTFDLPVSLIARIEACRRGHGFKTASEVVRLGIGTFDFEGCKPARDPHKQISVRVTAEQRAMLKRYSRVKDASVGELLRLALESLPLKPAKRKK